MKQSRSASNKNIITAVDKSDTSEAENAVECEKQMIDVCASSTQRQTQHNTRWADTTSNVYFETRLRQSR